MAKIDHTPVLTSEVLSVLSPKKGERYLDLTAGYGGHAALVLAETGNISQSTLVDRDANAVQVLNQEFAAAEVVQTDFLSASRKLASSKRQFDLILADLGVSSPHLNDASRGFSFQVNAPLDMRMDAGQDLTAAQVVNDFSEARLADILKNYGEEPKARQIASLIVKNRPLTSTAELAALAKRAWPGRSKTHPATRTFQALRMEVNGEIDQLNGVLPVLLELLAPGGRLAVISFHSLEDRIVKQFLAEHSTGYDAELELITKHPMTASQNELVFNPRARSAKLRAAAKIKIKGDIYAYPGKK